MPELLEPLATEATTASELAARLDGVPALATYGKVTRVVGLVIEASGLDVGLGELCRITAVSSERSVLAEVVGFHERGVLLMPLGEMDGLHPGSAVRALGRSFGVDVGPGLLGRVLNGLGHPIDGLGKLDVETRVPLSAEPPNPLTREMVGEVLETGVRAIDVYMSIAATSFFNISNRYTFKAIFGHDMTGAAETAVRRDAVTEMVLRYVAVDPDKRLAEL